jgi:eukaryotic-like serine/threonine-protein kinase
MSDPLATIESKYEILGKIKEGGMGAIYLVRHRLLGETRVVKVLRPQLDDQAEFHARFLREARTAIQLRHPNIAQLYDFTADEAGNAYIVMEYIEGLDLRELLRRTGPPPLGLTIEIAVQALAALGFLHRRSMVHRDISPDNLMLTRDADGKPVVKLVDLGIVKELHSDVSELTSTGVFVGKLRYGAPEQFGAGGAAALDQRADLYSFGVVLYELLTGKHPIQGESASQLIAGHIAMAPIGFDVNDPQGRVPAELRAIVMRLLAKKPEDRYPTAEALADALRALQPSLPWAGADVEHCFAGFTPAAQAAPVSPSTQERLDRQFAGRGTPPPPTVSATAPTAGADATAPTRPMALGEGSGGAAAAYQTGPTRKLAPAEASAPPALGERTTPTVPIPAPLPPAPPPAPAAAPAATPRKASVAVLLAAAALVVAAALGAGAWLLRDRLAGHAVKAAPAASSGGTTVAAGEGMLVVHAVPWATVVSITDASGAARPLPAEAVTPLALEVPAGKYSITLRSPSSGATTVLKTEVRAGETTRALAEVERVDAVTFLSRMGVAR